MSSAGPFKTYVANSVDPDQTAPMSSLIRVHTVCLYAEISLWCWQLDAADDFGRWHFWLVYLSGSRSDVVYVGLMDIVKILMVFVPLIESQA